MEPCGRLPCRLRLASAPRHPGAGERGSLAAMTSRGQSDSRFGKPSSDHRWPTRARAAEPAGSYHYLLDLDLDLAEELDVRMRLAARPSVTAMVFKVDPGQLR